MIKMKSNIIDLELEIEHQTEKAVLVRNLNGEETWLAKSIIEIEYLGNNSANISLPENIASDKGLI